MKKPQRPSSDGRSWARLLIGLTVVLVGLIIVMQSGFGIVERRVERRGVPMSFFAASEFVRIEWHLKAHQDHELEGEEETAAELTPKIPGVVIAHGFSANRRLMSGYAYKLAHSGYGVVLMDFPGHGDNASPFDREGLQAAIDAAYELLADQVEIDSTRVALIGHSMGSGAVIEAALRNPERYAATIALSPVDAEVTPLTPRNLQLQAGGREPAYLANAEMLLESAGGPSQDFAAGRARELVTIPAAGHIDILMRSPSHAAAVGWLDRALEADPTLREPYTDRRMLGWLLQIIGWMVVVSSMAVAYEPPDEHRLREPWYPAAAALSPLVATLIFAVVANLVDLSRLFGVLIGGGVGIWMLLAGGLYLAFGARLPMPVMLQWVRGGVLFVILWVIIGLSGEFVWMDWGLSGRRLMLFPLFALMSIPWFTAAAAVQEESGRRRWIVWMVHTVALVAGLWLLGLIAPGMTLVNLILPLIVLFYSVLAYMTTRFNDPWVAGIGCGAFWGWLLASAFPIVG